jgi:hypothetical protein
LVSLLAETHKRANRALPFTQRNASNGQRDPEKWEGANHVAEICAARVGATRWRKEIGRLFDKGAGISSATSFCQRPRHQRGRETDQLMRLQIIRVTWRRNARELAEDAQILCHPNKGSVGICSVEACAKAGGIFGEQLISHLRLTNDLSLNGGKGLRGKAERPSLNQHLRSKFPLPTLELKWCVPRDSNPD